jgi:hypothetical protein
MNRRQPVGWYLALVLLVIVAVTTSVVLLWTSSAQQLEVNDFYATQNGEIIDDEEYRYWDSISRHAYTMQSLVAPTLLTGAVVAIFAMLAVLAFRWERRRQDAAADASATDAPAATS